MRLDKNFVNANAINSQPESSVSLASRNFRNSFTGSDTAEFSAIPIEIKIEKTRNNLEIAKNLSDYYKGTTRLNVIDMEEFELGKSLSRDLNLTRETLGIIYESFGEDAYLKDVLEYTNSSCTYVKTDSAQEDILKEQNALLNGFFDLTKNNLKYLGDKKELPDFDEIRISDCKEVADKMETRLELANKRLAWVEDAKSAVDNTMDPSWGAFKAVFSLGGKYSLKTATNAFAVILKNQEAQMQKETEA